MSHLSQRWLGLGRIVAHSGDDAARHCPKIEAGHAAVGAVATPILLEELARDFAMMVDHAQATLDCQVIKGQHVGTLKTEEQDHLRRPASDAW